MLNLMGDKVNARKVAEDSGVPIVPGSNVLKSVDELLEVSNNIGYPVMLKAAGGGGGKGMRVLHDAKESEKGFSIIQSEASKAFDNPEIYVEKFINNGRHIEVQILGDKFGNYVHLGERECSVQRNNQKLIEECPSSFVDKELREVLTSKSIDLARKVNYVGAGTVEFLVDEDKNFYFIEMNTRIQVEHTVTEMVYMMDLVKEQIKMHYGKEMSFNQELISSKGHSIECRLNAEDPFNNFAPSPKKIDSLNFPGGIFFIDNDTNISIYKSTGVLVNNKNLNNFLRKRPLTVNENMPAAKALNIMNEKKITSLLVVSDKDYKRKNKIKLKGIIHIHFLLQYGLK